MGRGGFAGDGASAADRPAHTSQATAAPSTEGAQQYHPLFSALLKVTRSWAPGGYVENESNNAHISKVMNGVYAVQCLTKSEGRLWSSAK